MQNLTGISGNLIIENNGQLSNLDGLQNLAIVDGLFYIDNNDLLTSLDELYSLVYIGDDFALRYNDLLANIRILPPLPQDLPLMPSWQLLLLGLSVLSIGGLSYRKLF